MVAKWSKDLIVENVYQNVYQEGPRIILSDFQKFETKMQQIPSNFDFLFQALIDN